MILRPPRSTRTDTLFPYTTLFRSDDREERSSDDPSVTAVRSGNRRPLPLTGAWRAAPYRARRQVRGRARRRTGAVRNRARSEEHTSELQSLMRISYAVFCLQTQNTSHNYTSNQPTTQTTLEH